MALIDKVGYTYWMTATAHALVGGAIAASVINPAIGLPLAALSHPILDMIPHWDLGIGWRGKNKVTLFVESALDLIVGILLAYFIFGQNVNPIYFLSCILVYHLPLPEIIFNLNLCIIIKFFKALHFFIHI